MNFKDSLPLEGEVLITATNNVTGQITTLVHDKNLIVLNGRNILANCLSSGSGTAITDVTFGSGGTVAGSPSQVLSVSPTQIGVNIPIAPAPVKGTDYTFSIDSSAIPAPSDVSSLVTEVRPKLVFNIAIPTTPTSLNGLPVSEMSLTLSTGTAFAVKCFSTINKSDSISITISWTIYL